MSARPRRGQADKFAHPTNRYQQEQHDLKRKQGFIVHICPLCQVRRWYREVDYGRGAETCEVCAKYGPPSSGPNADRVQGLTPAQEMKRREMESEDDE